MRHLKYLLVLAIFLVACEVKEPDSPISGTPKTETRVRLEFLTREGCKNTGLVLERLKQAISDGKVSAEYTMIDQGTLAPGDPRTGYPTPTILLKGKDIFGLPVPTPPFPEPS